MLHISIVLIDVTTLNIGIFDFANGFYGFVFIIIRVVLSCCYYIK